MIWVLIFTMPSGSRWVLGPNPKEDGDGIALFPVEEGKEIKVKGAFGFKTEAEAIFWIKETAKMSEQGAKLMNGVQPLQAHQIQ